MLIVGLGNPGAEYAGTRHNLGWACLEEFAHRQRAEFDRQRWHSLLARLTLSEYQLWLIKPQTFMNLSGRAVAAAVRDLEIDSQAVWVVHDELDLPLGRLRIRKGGSSAGHNGIRSLTGSLGSEAFVRFRVGVGKPNRSGREAGIRHVLSRFTPNEKEIADQMVVTVADALETAIKDGVEAAMAVFNRREVI